MSQPQLARHILHVDMDAFYASIEQLDRPEYQGKPVIVGGSADSRGVVSAASYEARKYGVHSAMPTARARRVCPDGIFLPVRMERYREVSRAIRDILDDYTDLVEPLSLDEAFLDVGGSLRLFGSAVAIGHAIKARIKRETLLTASVGVAGNKLLAKLASDFDKPDGFTVIDDREAPAFIAKLPVRRLWGVGPATAEQLAKLGIAQVGQLQRWSKTDLQRRFGQAHGAHLFDVCRGIDTSAVLPRREAKSISSEHTFAVDETDQRVLQRTLLGQCEEVGSRLREQDLVGQTVVLKVRFRDFKTITRSHSLSRGSHADDVIYQAAWEMLQRVVPLREPVRLLGAGMTQLQPARRQAEQLFLFDTIDQPAPGSDQLLGAMDEVRKKFGPDAVTRARLIPKPDDTA